jgi:hypothetical protein
MNAALKRNPVAFVATGQIIAKTIGDTTIELQYVREGVYTVATYKGTVVRQQIDIVSWGDEQAARDHAAGLVQMLANGQTITVGLAALKTLAAPRQVRGTIAGAHLADITDPQQNTIDVAAALDGTVRRSKAHPLPVLRALARKGFGTLNYEAGRARRKVVESLTLNSRGWTLARTAVTS